jgi:aminoglycoside phosphotransferase (APT) family kinase protein
MAASLGFSGFPTELKRLTGGLECETYLFTLGNRRLVVKVCTRDGSDATTEFDNLSIVSAADVPTPDPVYLDASGDWFGVPAIVMSALPGSPDLHPVDVGRWVRGAANGLAAIHAVDSGNAQVVKVPRWQRWQPQVNTLGDRVGAVEDVLARFHERADRYPKVFSHDDYNPGNVLFHDGDLSGVVDWADVTVEPAQAAVAQYRHLLAVHPGGDAPDQFLAAYASASDRPLADMPLWDVLYGLRGLPAVDHWVRAFSGFGVDLTVDDINARSLDWVIRALTESRRSERSRVSNT